MQSIARGRTAEIFPYGEGKIVKLFFPQFTGAADTEYGVMEIIGQFPLPMPRMYGRVEMEGRKGLIYQRVEGRSLLEAIFSAPEKAAHYGERMARLHKEILAVQARTLPRVKDRLRGQISRTALLDEAKKQRIFAYMDTLPDGDALCHMDFHAENIMFAGEDYFVIDWITAGRGDPAMDICRARMIVWLSLGNSDFPILGAGMTQLVESAMGAYYAGLGQENVEKAARWVLPVYAARLEEGIAPEQKPLLLAIDRALDLCK